MGAPARHGLHGTRAYKSWGHMMARCYNENNKKYKDYGARGITVCPEWHDVELFVRDMGERPAGTSLERVNNSLGYSKENCIWANAVVQARNRRLVKLSLQKANEIRAAYSSAPSVRGAKTKIVESLAKQYTVSVAAIRTVLSRRSWS